jgi:hypothetical protein
MPYSISIKKVTYDDLKPGDFFVVKQAMEDPGAAYEVYVRIIAPKDVPDSLSLESFKLVKFHSQTAVIRYSGRINIELDER